jgi:hypothetical protein
MKSSRAILVAFIFFVSGIVGGYAGVRSFDQLSLDEQLALQRSESHVVFYDRELLTLDRELKQSKISSYDYQWQNQELVSYVNVEASFQNAILKERPLSLQVDLPEGATKVLRTVGKYSLGISAGLLEGILKGGGNFSP